MPEESSDRSVDKFNPELAFVGGVEESSARSETTGGRSEDLNTKAREGGEGEGKAFVLSPVQDELSDQSNTAPKKIYLPMCGTESVLGRNPFTGVMDALVSRDVMRITTVHVPDGTNNNQGKVKLTASKAPNKLTLNGEESFTEAHQAKDAKIGDIISLYGIKYRYILGYEKIVAGLSTTGGVSLSNTSQSSDGSKKNAGFGVKVAPEAAAEGGTSRMSSRKKSTLGRNIKDLGIKKEGGVNYLAWGFFLVLSGCMVAMVVIFAMNQEGDEGDGRSVRKRALRGIASFKR